MRLIEWEVAEDGYEEQIVIPKGEKGSCRPGGDQYRKQAESDGTNHEFKNG